MKRLYAYLFVKKDPVLMAMPYRRLIGVALMIQGFVFIVIGLTELTGGI